METETYLISCYTLLENPTLRHYAVPKEVYMYIKQLESYIKYPSLSGLKNKYPFRFHKIYHHTIIDI